MVINLSAIMSFNTFNKCSNNKLYSHDNNINKTKKRINTPILMRSFESSIINDKKLINKMNFLRSPHSHKNNETFVLLTGKDTESPLISENIKRLRFDKLLNNWQEKKRKIFEIENQNTINTPNRIKISNNVKRFFNNNKKIIRCQSEHSLNRINNNTFKTSTIINNYNNQLV